MSEPIDARPLPHDLGAERAVLGAILVSPALLFDVAEHVRPEDFYRDAHRRIFRHMLRLNEAKTAIDGLTVVESLARSNDLEAVGGPAYVYGLTDGMPRASHGVDYARIVRERATLRALVLAMQKATAEALDAAEPAADVLDHALAGLFGVAARTAGQPFATMPVLMPALLDEIERLVADQRRVTGVATGFCDLDDMTRGLQAGDLVIVAARPSMGKTTFAMNVAQYAALKDGRKVLVFSLEMGRKSLGLRLLASEARVDHHRILSGNLPADGWGRLSTAIGRYAEAAIYIDDSATVSVFDIRARARRLKADGGLDLVIVDYLQLMTGAKAENKNLEIAAITKALKAVARDLEVPVVLLSQLSREPDKRGNHRPQLSDLRDSGAIEQDADVVIFIHREEKYAATDENRGQAEAILAKQRNGPTGTVRLHFHDQFVRFDNAVPFGASSRSARTPDAEVE